MAPISGSVNARVPSGWVLLLSVAPISVGLPSAGNLDRAFDNTGELVPERRSGDWCEAGDTVQHVGGGGVSDSDPPEVDLRRPPDGGVPMANCTAGGEIELISQLLFRCSDRFMLIG